MFRKTMKVALACAFGIQTLAGVSAFAQTAPGSQNCTCATSSQAAGTITSIKGNVLVSQANGMRPAPVGSPLGSQSRIIVGSAGSATIGLGGCKLSIAGNSQAVVSRIGNQLCVKVESLVITPVHSQPEPPVNEPVPPAHEPVTTPPSTGSSFGPLVAGVAAIGGGIGLVIALTDGDGGGNNNAPASP